MTERATFEDAVPQVRNNQKVAAECRVATIAPQGAKVDPVIEILRGVLCSITSRPALSAPMF